MAQDVLYLGDSSLATAASYLGGVLAWSGLGFDYLPSDREVDEASMEPPRRLFILSDYASKMMDGHKQAKLLKQVEAGAGLLMIGGWESFCGLGGDWAGTPVGEALPVLIARTDDRVNYDQPCMVQRVGEHPILAELPWETRPPGIGGYNRVQARPSAQTLLIARRFRVYAKGKQFSFDACGSDPLLVVGAHGRGRTAALATDAAPHWVGGLVDWGEGRVKAQAPGAEPIEVGDSYAAFVRQLCIWTGGLSLERSPKDLR